MRGGGGFKDIKMRLGPGRASLRSNISCVGAKLLKAQKSQQNLTFGPGVLGSEFKFFKGCPPRVPF